MAKFQVNMISYALERTIDLTVIVPTTSFPEALGLNNFKPSHVVESKYPVLYLMHGLGNNQATWGGYSNIELFAEERNIAVVMFSGENKFYTNIPAKSKYPKFGDDWDKFIDQELPEFVTNYFPISAKPEDTYIAGLSMGGAGALMHGIRNPQKYHAVGAFSAAIVMTDKDAEKRNMPLYDPRPDIDKDKKQNLKLPKFYIACGGDDGWHVPDKALVDYLRANDYHADWSLVPGFKHEWRFWNQQVEKFLDWLPREDAYAKKGKRQI